MSDERRTRDADLPADDTVSARYREVATERAPATLNETILRMAAAHSDKAYARAGSWLRPLAWAATIGLSLAIVLELTDVDQPDTVQPEAQAIDGTAEPAPGETLRRKAKQAPPAAAPAAPEAPVAAPAEEQPAADVKAGGQRPDSAANAFHIESAPMIDEAEDMARMRQETERDADASGMRLEQAADALDACNAPQRATPERWMACIERLREEGASEAADREFEELLRQHPDFEKP